MVRKAPGAGGWAPALLAALLAALPPCGRASGGASWLEADPFPPSVPRQLPAQRAAMAALRTSAARASAEATPKLLQLLAAPSFRAKLRDCCAASGVADRTPQQLLDILRENVYAAELVHNFDSGGHNPPGLSLEIATYNATSYFPTTWQLLNLGYFGPDRMNKKYGQPASPFDSAEEGVYKLQPFTGKYDVPSNYEEASSRLQYVALNMLRVDACNPMFGPLCLVFSPSYWRDAVAAAPIDSGMYTFCCNQTYMQLNGSLQMNCSSRFEPAPVCDAGEITPGVYGAMDHALLNNHNMWGAETTDLLGTMFARWFGEGEEWTNVTQGNTHTFMESDILGNILYAERGIKLLVAQFPPLFGTARGELIREFAATHGIAVAWAMGPGLLNVSGDLQPVSFRSYSRLLDHTTSTVGLLNVTIPDTSMAVFGQMWDKVRALRAHNITQANVSKTWDVLQIMLSPASHLRLPVPGACADWDACLGTDDYGDCVCYNDRPVGAATIVV